MDKHFVYMYTNKKNGKRYIGQTNNISNRKQGHKSDSFNPKSSGYNLPIHVAIREDGLDNFTFETLEESLTAKEADEKEKYWIEYYQSLISQNGYNITKGGKGGHREPLTWEELLAKGKVFSGEEIEDIQKRLVRGDKYDDIMQYYSPRLQRTFLSNLNTGVNYKNPALNYPLKKNFHGEGRFTPEQIAEIKKDIKTGESYSTIKKRWGIQSKGFLSMINTGKYYFEPNEKYPLIVKGCADKSWIIPCLYDIIFSSDSLATIAKKHNKAKGTIHKLSRGDANRQEHLIYPLRPSKEENKEIFNKYFK